MLSLCHLLPKGSGSSTKVIAAGAAGLCRGQGQGSCSSGSCRCCRAEDPASAAATLAALLLTGGADPLIEQCLCLPYACLCRNGHCFQQKLAAISLQQSAWRFITAWQCLLGRFYSDRSSDIFSTFLAGVTVRSSDSRVANKSAHTKRKIAGLELNKRLQEEESSSRWRGADGGGGEQSAVEGSNERWRGTIRGGETLLEVEGSNQRQREAIRSGGK